MTNLTVTSHISVVFSSIIQPVHVIGMMAACMDFIQGYYSLQNQKVAFTSRPKQILYSDLVQLSHVGNV